MDYIRNLFRRPPVTPLAIAIPLPEADDALYTTDVQIFGETEDYNYSPTIGIRHGRRPGTNTIVSLVEQLKCTIMSSHLRHSKEILDLNILTKVELILALIYLDDINKKTPKNKTRPKIRALIIKKLNS